MKLMSDSKNKEQRKALLMFVHIMAKRYLARFKRANGGLLLHVKDEAKAMDLPAWFLRQVFSYCQTTAPDHMTVVRLNKKAVEKTAKQLGSMTHWKDALPYVQRLGFKTHKDVLFVTTKPNVLQAAQEEARLEEVGDRGARRLMDAKEQGLLRGKVPPMLKAFSAGAGR